MAYMNRLGIWGEGTPFKEFTNFIQAVERRLVYQIREFVSMTLLFINSLHSLNIECNPFLVGLF